MEIDITDFVLNAESHELSASVAEIGVNAGKITWANAVNAATTTQLITEAARPEFEAWAKEFGAWSREEIEAWTLVECNALLIQFISGDLNILESLCYSETDKYSISWCKAERLANDGTISGSIYKGENGRVYFYMGN